MSKRLASLLVLLAAVSCLVWASSVWAQVGEETSTTAPEKKPSALWEDMLHYIKVAQAEAARSNATALLDSGVSPGEVYNLSVEYPDSLTTLRRGDRLEGMKDPIARIRKMIEEGYEAERSDPEQIAEAIKKLDSGSLEAIKIAQERLKKSGEYALPKLVGVLTDDDSSARLKERVINVLPMLGKEAVRGLSCALQSSDPKLVQNLAYALGQIEYPHAAPRLKEALERENLLGETRKYVEAALIRTAGRKALNKTAASLFYEWSEKYYYAAESVTPDMRYDKANVWYWSEGVLSYKPVPREIFNEVYAMRYSRLSLEHDPKFYPAVSLWLSAIIKKETDLPEDTTDPVRGENQPDADFYALASSPQYLQAVLARALKDGYSPVATAAIEALAKTSGPKSLVEPVEGGVQPLVTAMTYPDRNVRFLAAWALGNAKPQKDFRGSQLVVPVLAEAVRQTGEKTALLVAADEQRNVLKAACRAAGYKVIDEPDASKAALSAVDNAGVDVVVLGSDPEPAKFVRGMRQLPTLVGTPVLIATINGATRGLQKTDTRVVVVRQGVAGQDVADALAKAIELGAGKPFSPQEATTWAVRACESLRGLGVSGNTVLNVDVARPALMEALDADADAVKIAAAGALATLWDASAQRGIVSLALSTDASETVRVQAFKYGAESARRFGSQVTNDQAAAVVDTVLGDGSADLKQAAAQLQGALNLPSEKIKDLILSTAGQD
ncbi:MAG: HEAT repeat domain-containing protein [Phycisphaerae bacterium]